MEYPFGRSKGTPLNEVSDKDLAYLVKYYNEPDKEGKSRLTGKFGANNMSMLAEVNRVIADRKVKDAKKVIYLKDVRVSMDAPEITLQLVYTRVLEVVSKLERIESILGLVRGQDVPEDQV